jgi:putative ABC transport system permease protein
MRTLFKNKAFSLLNIVGLAVGITCASLIFLWVENEYSYNDSFPKRDRLYRIMEIQTYEGKPAVFVAEPLLMAAAIKKEIPGIKESTRLYLGDNFRALFSVGDKGINEQGKYADSSIFAMLDLPFVYGTPRGAFRDLNSIVISRSMSSRFFGETNPVGKTVKMEDAQEYKVTGVFQDLPSTTTFVFQWLIPFDVYASKQSWATFWGANGAATYVELDPSANVDAVNRVLKGYLGTKQPGLKTQCFLFPMKDWNLRAKFTDGKPDGGKITFVRLFSLIAWIILGIACINFMNLATARSGERAKEVGVRKVMGAGKAGLVRRFIGEALVLSYGALGVSLVLLYICLPSFNRLVQENLSLHLGSPLHLGFLLGIATLSGLAAGSYPAFYLSSFNPVQVFKGLRLKMAQGTILVRKGLVIAQFTISIGLIVCTAVIYQQLAYVNTMDLGYTRNNQVYVELKGQAPAHADALRAELLATGVVDNAASSEFPISAIWSNTDNFSWAGKDPGADILVSLENVGPGYLSTMHIPLKEGRDFYPEPGMDSASVLINESMATRMGKSGRVGGYLTGEDGRKVKVVGIFKDFVYNDFYHSWGPLVFYSGSTPAPYMNIALKPTSNMKGSLDKIGGVIKSFSPAYPVEFSFLDEEIGKAYKTEMLTGRLATVFAGLAIFISCLGLFGLAAYTAERRSREIGIRKVLGASVSNLMGLLSRDFVQLVGISCILAFPIAWWAMQHWLSNFSYRTALHWWVFALSGGGALGIAVVTVSYQAFRAAIASPVKTLRSE